MIIAIEVQRLFRPKKHGMEIVALEIIRQLQKIRNKNTYIVFAKEDTDTNCIGKSANFSVANSNSNAYPLWEQKYLPSAIEKSKPDILHCTANTAPLFCKTPMIITIHDIIYLESINFSGSAYQNFGNLYRRIIVPLVAKKAAFIITVSAYEKRRIVKRLKVSASKVKVVYNGVNEQFKPITDQNLLNNFRDKYGLPKQFLLHFGNTAPKKNTIGVLRAFELYVNAVSEPLPLVLTDCTLPYITGLLKQIGAPALIKHIQVLAYVPFDNIPCLYNLATVFLYPSHRESFGMPVIEAMACGLPVITSDTSALPEIAGGAACLVNPEIPSEICAYILKLLVNKDFYNETKDKGFTNATRFNWKDAADKTLAVYTELEAIISLQQKNKALNISLT